MGKDGHEEALIKQQRTILSLMREVDYKNQKLLENEHRYNEEVASMREVIVGLTKTIEFKDRSLLAVENKYNGSLTKVRSLMSENDELRERYHQEIKKLKIMTHEMESLKKELGKVANELGETKALYELQQKNSIEEIEKLKRKLADHDMENVKKELRQVANELEQTKALKDQHQKSSIEEIEKLKEILADQYPAEGCSNLTSQINTLRKELEDKMEHIEDLESRNNALVVLERKYKQELLDARKESIDSLRDMFCRRSQLGIRRMGELDAKPFQDLCLEKFSSEKWEEISAQLCSSWQENLKNPHWHPFKIETVDGSLKETLDENDEKLKGLREEYGAGVYKAVANALLELEEYNPSGRYAVPEIWNWKEGRRASLKEIIEYIIRQLKTHKRKRRF